MVLILLLPGCGSEKPTQNCIPNYEENGLGLLVSKHPSHLTSFQFEVCFIDPKLDSTVTVYGFDTEQFEDLNVNAWWRLADLELQKGSRFTVTFSGDDNYFVIYKNSATNQMEKTTKIISGILYADF